MLSRPYAADLTVPAGTAPGAPVTLVVPCPTGHVIRGTLTVPDGPNGLAGWQLLLAGTPIVPFTGAGWIVTNDNKYVFELAQDVNTGQLVVAGYNTGVYPHTFHFYVDWMPPGQQTPVTAVLAASSTAADQTSAAVAALTGYDTGDQAQPDTGLDAGLIPAGA